MAKLQEQEKVPQPLTIPEDFVNGTALNMGRIEEVLGLTDGQSVGDLLRYLYFTDVELNYRINVALLRLAIEKVNDRVHLPTMPPDYLESAWMGADIGCEHCPGSEIIEHFPGVFGPQCLNHNRAEKYVDCFKYRENLEANKLTEDEVTNATRLVAERIRALMRR